MGGDYACSSGMVKRSDLIWSDLLGKEEEDPIWTFGFERAIRDFDLYMEWV